MFFLIQQPVFSCLRIVKTQLGACNVSHMLSVRRLGDSSHLHTQRVICQLYHLSAVQIHFKQIAVLRSLMSSVGQKIYGFSVQIEGIFRKIE